ncbi:Cell division control protein 25 [Purpureocillium lavendulum]|uniref:Cell division control protein 25 n=1 Tax=Purpureocillium lavendulum TaxID=1247861 RepID=A0AB34FLQ7_9HYPO|nr:Cell division control protein 25 [Purpureocillium lavendulum]
MANDVSTGIPKAGQIISIMLSLTAATILTLFLTQRFLAIRSWNRLPLVVWLVFAIYIDSYLFVFATATLSHAFGVNASQATCEGAILLCLVCYVTTKFIYVFLVEKAHIIRGTPKTRFKSKLYLFNAFGMLSIYLVVIILNFIFRIAKMRDGTCIIGMKSLAMIPLISFDTVVNVYLTLLFLVPMRRQTTIKRQCLDSEANTTIGMYSFKNMARTPANLRLRTVALRTFIGAASTLISSIVNLSVLMALNGEPGWVCLMCCNSDILFSAIVIQWVTSRDNAATSSTSHSSQGLRSHREAVDQDSAIASRPGVSNSISSAGTEEISLVNKACTSDSREDTADEAAHPAVPNAAVLAGKSKW